VQDDIIVSYEDDFPKYRKKVSPALLRDTMRSVAMQATKKFVYSQVGQDYKSEDVKKALDMLTLAGIVVPVCCTAANGLPLGSEADSTYRKMLLLDSGLMLRLLNMTLGDISSIKQSILTDSAAELVIKGPMAELIVGLEMLHYGSPNIRHSLYYWLRKVRNSMAEVDYVTTHKLNVLPIEVKAGVQGGMKSLWTFMHEKHLLQAVRCSLENFGSLEYTDQETGQVRNVIICPMYAVSMMEKLL
jgi:hypothetical protein